MIKLSKIIFLDLTAEDSGNYTCEVRGDWFVQLGYVTHLLHVIGQNYKLLISIINSTSLNDSFMHSIIEAYIFS